MRIKVLKENVVYPNIPSNVDTLRELISYLLGMTYKKFTPKNAVTSADPFDEIEIDLSHKGDILGSLYIPFEYFDSFDNEYTLKEFFGNRLQEVVDYFGDGTSVNVKVTTDDDSSTVHFEIPFKDLESITDTFWDDFH